MSIWKCPSCTTPWDPSQPVVVGTNFPVDYGWNYLVCGYAGDGSWPVYVIEKYPHPASTMMFSDGGRLIGPASILLWPGFGAYGRLPVGRHMEQANCAFVDGHAKNVKIEKLVDPAQQQEFWGVRNGTGPFYGYRFDDCRQY